MNDLRTVVYKKGNYKIILKKFLFFFSLRQNLNRKKRTKAQTNTINYKVQNLIVGADKKLVNQINLNYNLIFGLVIKNQMEKLVNIWLGRKFVEPNNSAYVAESQFNFICS